MARFRQALHMRLILSLGIVLLFAVLAAAAEVRTWTSSDGKFKVEGAFVAIKGDKVRLRRPDGQLLEIELGRLSRADQAYATQAAIGGNPKPPIPAPMPEPVEIAGGESPKFLSDPVFAEVVKELRAHRADKARAALSTVDSQDMVLQSEAIRAAGAIDLWWKQVLAGAPKLQVGDEIPILGEQAAIVQADAETITVRYQAKNYRFNLTQPETVPYGVANFAAQLAPAPPGNSLKKMLASVASLGLGGQLDAPRWKAAAVGPGPPRDPLVGLPDTGPLVAQPGVVEKKLAIPPAEAREKAKTEIRELMKKEIEAAKTPMQRYELARSFVKMANDSFPKEAASSFALVMEACETSAATGNVVGTLELVDWITSHFEVPGALTVRGRFYLKAMKALPPLPNLVEVAAQRGLELCDAALAASQFALADEISTAALSAARISRHKELIQQATDKKKSVVDLQAAEGDLALVRQTLAAKPDDPDANLKIGLYTAITRRDWTAGLPQLAKGADAELAAAAKLDLAAPDIGAKQMETADAWWSLSENPKHKPHATALQERARHWYQLALPNLNGLAKLKAEKRLGM